MLKHAHRSFATLTLASLILAGCGESTAVEPQSASDQAPAPAQDAPSSVGAVAARPSAPPANTPASTPPAESSSPTLTQVSDPRAAHAAGQPVATPVAKPINPVQLEHPPIFVVEDSHYEMGHMFCGETAVRELPVYNMGDEDLTISVIETACPCTTATISQELIPAGGSAMLRIEYENYFYPEARTGKQIRLGVKEYIGVEGRFPFAKVNIFLSSGFPIRINEGENPGIGSPVGEMVVNSFDAEPFTVKSISGLPFEYVDFDPATDEPRSTYTLRYDLTPYASTGYPTTVLVETDRPETPLAYVPFFVSADGHLPPVRIPASWTPEAAMILLQEMKPGESVELKIEHRRLPAMNGVLPDMRLEMIPEPVINTAVRGEPSESSYLAAELVDWRLGTKVRQAYAVVRFTLSPDAPEGMGVERLRFVGPKVKPDGAAPDDETLVTSIADIDIAYVAKR